MKNRGFILSFLILLITNFAFAQATPKKVSYQAVVRNAANELVVNQNLSVEITILNANNVPQYKETHASVPTNQNGLMWLWIGEGTPTLGTLDEVVWKDATIQSVFTLPGGNTVTQNTPVTAMPYAYYADEVDTLFLQNYLTTHDYGNDDYVTQEQLNDTLTDYLTINGLCDSIAKCEVITNLQHTDSLLGARIALDSTTLLGKIHSDSAYLKGLIDSCSTNITNNTTNITNNTTNISNITNYVTQLQAADSVLKARFAKDSIALSKRLDTMLTHLCDSIEQCEVITNLKNADSLLSVRITRDSILSYKTDSVLSTRIISDSVLFYKTDSVLLAHILNDSILSHQADSILLARIMSDSTNLANNYYTKDKINDTLSHYTTTDDINSLLGDYEKKSDLCNDVMNCAGIQTMQTNITNVANNLDSTKVNIRNEINNKVTNLQNADSVLSTRIISDSVLFYKTDSVLLAHILNDSILSHQVDSILLARIMSDSTNLANNYYTKDKINDTLRHYTTSDDVNNLLGDYEKKSDLCNDVMNCAGIQTMQTNITNVANNLDSTKVNIRNEINNKVTNLQKADSVLGARITSDSIRSYKADSVLSMRIINDSVIFYKTDSVLLAHILNDSILSHQVDSILLARILSDSTNLANNYYTMGKINDTLSHYTTTDDVNSMLGDYATKDTLKNYLTIDGLCDSIKKCEVITNLQNADSVLSARITADSTNLANNYYNKDKINDTVRYILGQITSTSGSLSNDYYTKDEIKDTLDHYTTSNSIDSLLRNYATKDTLKNYLTIDGLCDSIKKCDIISNLQNNVTNNTTNITNNTTNITNNTTNITNLMNADSALEARLIDTVSKLRLALKDSLSRYMDSAQVVRSIHDSIGNGTLSIKYGSNDPVIFTANQKTPSSIVIPSSEAPVYGTLILQKNGTNIDEFTANTDKTINIEVPTKLSQLANDGGTYAKRDSVNVFTAANNFTGGSITVPSNGTDIPRPAASDPTSCNNNNAVAVCDLLAVFDSLSNRIKKLEDELAAMNQPTSAVSVSLSEITRTSLKATATMNDSNLNVTSYEICISESASMSDSSCQTISTTNEYTFTGLKPNTVYYVTAKAYHNSGTATSDVASGKTLPLTLDISISPASPVCLCDSNPTTVTYTANIEDANMDDYSFLWSVPDGNPLPDNPDERICTITYSVSASYKVTCTATLQANPTVQLTADTTITVQICTTPTITTCETDSTVTVKSVTGNPDFIDWNDGNTGNSVSENSTHTYSNPGAYEIEVSQDGCSYKHKVAMGEAALYPCSVSSAHTDPTEYTGTSSASPGTGGLETTDSEGKVTHVADQDGNIYPVVQIGSQCWMAKNLRTTHYSDEVEEIPLSQPIPNNSNHQYDDTLNKAYRYAPALGMDYLSSWGYYYNWKAAMYEGTNANNNQGICPKGWHLPSKEEWETMATVVNGSEVVFPYGNHTVQAGTLAGKLSSGCTWQIDDHSYPETVEEGSPYDYDYPERNASGFSSVPTGWVEGNLPHHYDKHTYAYYWSSTYNPNNSGEAYVLWWNSRYNYISLASGVTINVDYRSAVSVRCLRDEMALTTYPTLSVTPSATSLLLCPGTSEDVTYTAAVVVNGETKTTDYSYTWSVTNTKTNTTTTLENHSYQVTIPYSDSANYKVSCVANSNTTADSATNSVMTLVRLKVAPSFTIQDPSGFTVTLNNITNTNQIVWDNNHANTTTEDLSVNQTSATHTYGAAGTYEITAYSAGNCSLTQTVGIQVSVVLNSSNNTAFCPNSSTTVTYTATVDGAEASGYSWTVEKTSGNAGGFAPAQSSGSSNSFEVTYNATGTYTVSCTATLVGGGSLGKATTTTITTNEAPVFNTCVDGKWLTVSGMSNVATIHWTLSGTGESVDTDDPLRSHNYDDNESDYSIKVLSSAGCEATASGDLGTTPSTYCRVQTVDPNNEVHDVNDDHKLLQVKDNVTPQPNSYSVVQIGSQCWMAENLRAYTSYNVKYPNISNVYYSKFGYLYDRTDATATNSCPTGWHLPSLAEWEQMESVVSGSTISHSSTNYVGNHAGLLAGVCDWTNSDVTSSPGNNAQNTFGFRVLPAGNRDLSYPGVDYHLGQYASFWCSDEGGVAWTMKFDKAGTMKETVPTSSYYISVRCVRDEAAVLPTPTMSIDPDPNNTDVSFCPEKTQKVTYTASLTFDNQPVACNSYEWSVTSEDAVGFTAIQQNTQTPSFEMTYSIPGTYTVSCTATPSGYNSANASVSTTVTHKAAPSFTVSKAGRTVTLGSLQHVNTISWFENDSQHGTETNPYTYPIDGTNKITVYSEDNCSIDTNVTVNALPVQTSVPEISGITANSMTVTPHFSGTIASYTYCYSTNNDMSGAYCSEAVTETSHNFMGLTPNTTYYVQVTATNAGGSTNSTIVSAQTLTPVPSAQVDTADVASNSFKVNATQITNATALQVCYVQSTEECPNDIDTCATENDVANVSNTTQTIENLTASTSYCVIVKVSNAYSTTIYGPWKVTTKAESSGGGQETPTINRKLSCVLAGTDNHITTNHPSINTDKYSNNKDIEKGRDLGNGIVVLDSVSDYQGNWYEVVQIGTQCWLKENMRATKYSNGTEINPSGAHPIDDGTDLILPSQSCWAPNLKDNNIPIYGLLYNWGAAMNIKENPTQTEGLQGICPTGWHVPSLTEWETMKSYVDDQYDPTESNNTKIAGILSSSEYWPHGNYTNTLLPRPANSSYPYLDASGFSALPAGSYVRGGSSSSVSRTVPVNSSTRAQFWTSTRESTLNYCGTCLYWTSMNESVWSWNDTYGLAASSVRCVRTQ